MIDTIWFQIQIVFSLYSPLNYSRTLPLNYLSIYPSNKYGFNYADLDVKNIGCLTRKLTHLEGNKSASLTPEVFEVGGGVVLINNQYIII